LALTLFFSSLVVPRTTQRAVQAEQEPSQPIPSVGDFECATINVCDELDGNPMPLEAIRRDEDTVNGAQESRLESLLPDDLTDVCLGLRAAAESNSGITNKDDGAHCPIESPLVVPPLLCAACLDPVTTVRASPEIPDVQKPASLPLPATDGLSVQSRLDTARVPLPIVTGPSVPCYSCKNVMNRRNGAAVIGIQERFDHRRWRPVPRWLAEAWHNCECHYCGLQFETLLDLDRHQSNTSAHSVCVLLLFFHILSFFFLAPSASL
jgi:hypothetical protein